MGALGLIRGCDRSESAVHDLIDSGRRCRMRARAESAVHDSFVPRWKPSTADGRAPWGDKTNPIWPYLVTLHSHAALVSPLGTDRRGMSPRKNLRARPRGQTHRPDVRGARQSAGCGERRAERHTPRLVDDTPGSKAT